MNLKLSNEKCCSVTAVFCQDYESSAMCSITNDAVLTEVDETQSHMQPVVEKQEPDDVRCVIYAVFRQKQTLHFCCTE